MPHALGLIHDRQDQRDLRFSAVANQHLACLELPPRVDLRPLCSPVRDQLALGACSSFATVTGLWECLWLRAKGLPRMDTFSPLFEYYWERVKEHTVAQDAGAMIRDGMKVLAKFGACPEQYWPYDVLHFRDRPTDFAITNAGQFRLAHYHRVHNLIEVKQALVLNQPVVVGIEVWESFDSPAVAASGVVPMPNRDVERFQGGHAVCVVGYSDAERRFLVKNSWGTGWGQGGYFTLPYQYFWPEADLVLDLWTGSL
jgi:C1A family cysteine protease